MPINYWEDLEESKVYHVYNRSVGDLQIFREDSDYDKFLQVWEKYFTPYCHTLAFCLIPNHFHFLIKIKTSEIIRESLKHEKTKAAKLVLAEEKDTNFFLEDQLRRLFSSYALSFNYKYSRHGSVFSEKVKRVFASSESKILHWLCYIHHNPIHHYLCRNFKDWKYSSYNLYLSENDHFTDTKELLDFLSNKDVFISLHKDFKSSYTMKDTEA